MKTNDSAPPVKAAPPAPPRKKGFANLSPERQSEVARLGGLAAHAKGAAHEFDSAEARAAGVKGGLRSGEVRRALAAAKRSAP